MKNSLDSYSINNATIPTPYSVPVVEHVTEQHPNCYVIPMFSSMGGLHLFIDPDMTPREGHAVAMGRATDSRPHVYNLFQPEGQDTYSLIPCALDAHDRAKVEGLELEQVKADCWGVVVWFQPAADYDAEELQAIYETH